MKDGTPVTVRAFDVPAGWLGIDRDIPGSPDHMFIEYDDGRSRYIYRGGPQERADGSWALRARVDRAEQSPDFGRGQRVISETFLPGLTAQQAALPARKDALEVNRRNRDYLGINDNSNTVIGDYTGKQYGRRAGSLSTWGHQLPRPWIVTEF